MNYIKRVLSVVIGAALLAACAAPGATGTSGTAASAPAIETTSVRRGDITTSISSSGTVQPLRSADVSFNTTGTINEVLVAEGTRVEQDQDLARLDTTLLQAERDAAQAQRDAAQAQRDAAQAQRDRITTAEDDDDQAVDTSDAAKKQADAQLLDAEAQIKQASVQFQQAEQSLTQGTIRAPFAGIVTSVNVASGDRTASGNESPSESNAPFTVADIGRFVVEATIDEADIGEIELNQTAELEIDAVGTEPITGTVSQIASAAQVEQDVATYAVRIHIPESATEDLKIGMTASIEVNTSEEDYVLVIPTSALRSEGSQRIVRVQQGTAFVDRAVSIGLSNDVEAEVVDGLQEGDVIATVGSVPNQ